DRAARGVRARHAGAGHCALGRAEGPRAALERGSLLRRCRRVRREPGPARARGPAQAGVGREREALRRGGVSLGDGAGAVQVADRSRLAPLGVNCGTIGPMSKGVLMKLTIVALFMLAAAAATAQEAAPPAAAEVPKPATLGFFVYPGQGQDAA